MGSVLRSIRPFGPLAVCFVYFILWRKEEGWPLSLSAYNWSTHCRFSVMGAWRDSSGIEKGPIWIEEPPRTNEWPLGLMNDPEFVTGRFCATAFTLFWPKALVWEPLRFTSRDLLWSRHESPPWKPLKVYAAGLLRVTFSQDQLLEGSGKRPLVRTHQRLSFLLSLLKLFSPEDGKWLLLWLSFGKKSQASILLEMGLFKFKTYKFQEPTSKFKIWMLTFRFYIPTILWGNDALTKLGRELLIGGSAGK